MALTHSALVGCILSSYHWEEKVFKGNYFAQSACKSFYNILKDLHGPSTDRKPPILLRQPFKTSHRGYFFCKCMMFVSVLDVTSLTSRPVSKSDRWNLVSDLKIKCSHNVFIGWLSLFSFRHEETNGRNFCSYQFQLELQSAEHFC